MKRYSLYTLVLVLLLVIIVITSFFIYLSIDIQREKIIQEEIKAKIDLARTINEILYSPLWIYRIRTLPGLELALIKEAAKFKDIVYIRILLTDGSISQSTIRGEWGKKIEDPEVLGFLAKKEIITREETFRGERITSILYPGYKDYVISIGFSLKGAEKVIDDMIFYYLLLSLGSLILIILIIFFVFRQEILGPLKKITFACQEVRKGNLDVRIPAISKTEIGELAVTFNEMIKDLKESQAALEEAKTVLEIKVQARTRELRELTESLEEQVKERTRELQERMTALERFHRVAVGRELKMIELKKEIKKLKEKLKEK